MNNRSKITAKYRSWSSGDYHLCTDGWKDGKIFRSRKQFIYGMLLLGIITIKYNLRFYGFILMPNHIHIVLHGRGVDCVNSFAYLKRKLNKRLRAEGQPELPVDYFFKLIPIENKTQLRNNLLYVYRNSLEKQIAVPGGYPWSSCWLLFSGIASSIHGRKISDYSKRELYEMVGGRFVLPGNWEINEDIGLLPRFFVDTKYVESLFGTPKDFQTRLSKDYEAFVGVSRMIEDPIDWTESDVKNITLSIIDKSYPGKTISNLSYSERGAMAVTLYNKYNVSTDLIASCLLIRTELVNQFINSKDFGRGLSDFRTKGTPISDKNTRA